MNEEILIESKSVILGFEHLYLVFRDDDGSETVIRGGPQFQNPLNFGNIVVEVDIPINQSEDSRRIEGDPPQELTPADRNSRQVNLGNRDATAVWDIMRQQATNIHNANLDYNVATFAQNSNSTVVSVLNSVGLDLNDNLPVNRIINDFPGEENFLNFATNLEGKEANDIIQGYENNDTLKGGAGNDILNGGGGNDTIYGQKDRDLVIGLDGNDRLLGDLGRDTLAGGNGNDLLNGGSGNDTLYGQANNDRVFGLDGNDQLRGDLGNDIITGGAGNDILIGSVGDDTLTGGIGNDRYVFKINSPFNLNSIGKDTITDFGNGIDTINLSKTTFNNLASEVGNGFSDVNEFAVVSQDSLVASSEALIVYDSGNGNLLYNQNGSDVGLGSGGIFATLTGNPSISQASFAIIN